MKNNNRRRAEVSQLDKGSVLEYYNEEEQGVNGETIVLLEKPSIQQSLFSHMGHYRQRVDMYGIFLDGSEHKFWTWEEFGFLMYWFRQEHD